MANRIDIDNETYELAKHIANSQANLGFKKYLQLKGFDSVMYKNTGEDNWGDFSYLLFEHQVHLIILQVQKNRS